MANENEKNQKVAGNINAATKAKGNQTARASNKNAGTAPSSSPSGQSVYADKRKVFKSRGRKNMRSPGKDGADDFEQRIVDIARVTRVMAGGKRMRFRACVALGNKKGKIALGLAKGADVTIAVTKAVNKAKREFLDVPIVNSTIPHQIYQKYGAAKILLKPASRGRGVIAGGAARIILELAGIKNIASKNLGTNNKVNVAKCTIEALKNLKRVEKSKSKKERPEVKKENKTSAKNSQENNKNVS